MTTVDTLHVQLQLPNRVSQKYRRVCKEHAKLYLLNHTVQMHQVFRVNEFISIKIMSIRLKLQGDGVQDYSSSDLKGIILTTTRILFSSNDSSSLCRKGPQLDHDSSVQRSSVGKDTSDGTSRKCKLALCDDDYPNKERIFTFMKTKIIAEDILIRQIANSIVIGLKRDQLNFCSKDNGKVNDTRRGVSFSIPTGIILQSDLGGGKTALLKTLYELYGSKRSYLFSSKNLVGKNK